MIKPNILTCIAVLFVASLTGCGTSPPTQFIALAPRRAQVAAVHPKIAAPLAVGRISLPPELDRLPLVSYASNGRIQVDGTIRWAAPLTESIRRTLTFDLANRLGNNQVVLPGQPKPSAVLWLVLTIQTFAPHPDNRVDLKAHWSILTRNAHPQTIAQGEAAIQTRAQSTHSTALAAAMSDALATLADRITESLTKDR